MEAPSESETPAPHDGGAAPTGPAPPSRPPWMHATSAVAALGATIGLFAWIGSMDFPEQDGEQPAHEDAETAEAAQMQPVDRDAILVFSRTAGFRHDSIPEGIAALTELGAARGLKVEATEDPAAFTASNLARFGAVVFLNTTGDVLDEAQQKAFESYMASGGGYLGIHSAADTEYDWPYYGKLVGAYFARHPAIQEATVEVTDADHPATRGIDRFWKRTDEWYDYRAVPAEGTRILAQLDQQSYEGSSMPGPHPIAWCQEIGPSRALYTGGGHTKASYSEPAFRKHLDGALAWVTGHDEPASAAPQPAQ